MAKMTRKQKEKLSRAFRVASSTGNRKASIMWLPDDFDVHQREAAIKTIEAMCTAYAKGRANGHGTY